MADKNESFNGSTFTFADAAQAGLIGITDDETGAEIDVSPAGLRTAIHECGQITRRLNIELIGGVTIAVGTKGAAVITWNDGTTSPPITKACVFKRSTKGSKNNPISTTLTIGPSTDAQTAGA